MYHPLKCITFANTLSLSHPTTSMSRMDADQSARRMAQEIFKVVDPDYYEFEAHILFDDCMELDDKFNWVLNSFVKELINVINEAAR